MAAYALFGCSKIPFRHRYVWNFAVFKFVRAAFGFYGIDAFPKDELRVIDGGESRQSPNCPRTCLFSNTRLRTTMPDILSALPPLLSLLSLAFQF